MFFVESPANRGSEPPNRRIFAKKAGPALAECKDMIGNVRKRKKLKVLCVGITTLIAFSIARALHFADIGKPETNIVLKALKSSDKPISLYIILRLCGSFMIIIWIALCQDPYHYNLIADLRI